MVLDNLVAVIIVRNDKNDIIEKRFLNHDLFQKMNDVNYCLIKMLVLCDESYSVELRECDDEVDRIRVGSIIQSITIDENLQRLKDDYHKHKNIRDVDFWVSRFLFEKNKDNYHFDPATKEEMFEYEKWIKNINNTKGKYDNN